MTFAPLALRLGVTVIQERAGGAAWQGTVNCAVNGAVYVPAPRRRISHNIAKQLYLHCSSIAQCQAFGTEPPDFHRQLRRHAVRQAGRQIRTHEHTYGTAKKMVGVAEEKEKIRRRTVALTTRTAA